MTESLRHGATRCFMVCFFFSVSSHPPHHHRHHHHPHGLRGAHWHARTCTQCITNWHRENNYSSTLQLPDTTLNFAKSHPLMEDAVKAQPLLLTKGVNFTRLAVDRVSSLDQRLYNVLFIGTGKHWHTHSHAVCAHRYWLSQTTVLTRSASSLHSKIQ